MAREEEDRAENYDDVVENVDECVKVKETNKGYQDELIFDSGGSGGEVREGKKGKKIRITRGKGKKSRRVRLLVCALRSGTSTWRILC